MTNSLLRVTQLDILNKEISAKRIIWATYRIYLNRDTEYFVSQYKKQAHNYVKQDKNGSVLL